MAFSVFAVNSSAVATELPAGSSKATATNIPKYDVEYVSELNKAKEVDWFKFTTLSEDAYYTITLKNYNIPVGGAGVGDWHLKMFVYDEHNQEVVYNNSYYNPSANIKLEKNTTYYVKVVMGSSRNDSTGNCKFSINTDSVNTLSGISVSSLPDKLTYTVGEEFDMTGLAVTVKYSDGTSKAATEYTLSGFDSTAEGTKTITVSYTEGSVTKTCTFDVVVEAENVSSDSGFFLFDWFMAFINFIMNIFSMLF